MEDSEMPGKAGTSTVGTRGGAGNSCWPRGRC
jgi:hypothetical protein